MTDRPGYEPAHPRDPREEPDRNDEQAIPPSGFSFPDASNPSGPPAQPFSYPDASNPSGPPAPQYGQPGYGNPWGPDAPAPTSGYGSPYQPDPGVPSGPGGGTGWGFSGDPGAQGYPAQPAGGLGKQGGAKEQLAIAAMIAGLVATGLALIGCCTVIPRVLALVAGVAGVVLGIVAQQKISSSGGRLAGTPQAVIGIAGGGVAIFLALLIIGFSILT
jgi:hypothetical protein